MAKHEPVTFGKEVANALLRKGVPVQNRSRIQLIPGMSTAEGSYGPYSLPQGATLTSEQVTAAVRENPSRLAVRFRDNVYRWNGGAWERWSARASEPLKHVGWSKNPIFAPDRDEGPWELVYQPEEQVKAKRPDLKAEDTCPRYKTYYQAKQDNGKLRPSLIPWAGIWQVIKVGEFGAKKYSPGSWKHLPNAKARYSEALRRHVLELMDDIDAIDGESGLSSLSHLVWCGLAVLALNVMESSNEQH